jgi:hypothetical protein
MKLRHWITLHAVLAIGFGIAFALYGPLMLVPFGIPELPEDDVMLYWNVAAFARMFGGAQFSLGLLLFALRRVDTAFSTESRRGIAFSLFLGSVFAVFIATTQQFAIWLAPAGIVAIVISTVLAIGYLYYLVRP